MKTRTVFIALLLGFSLNSIAQKDPSSNKIFAAYKTSDAAFHNAHLVNNNLFLSGYDLEIAENKTRKAFADLTDLDEGFWIEPQSFKAPLELITESLPKSVIRANKYQNSLFFAQWTALSRLLEQEPNNLFKK
jgi:hypothetical protein